MSPRKLSFWHRLSAFSLLPLMLCAQSRTASGQQVRPPLLPQQQLAQQAFGGDAAWYLANIPFLEIDDPEIQRTYYYRWQVYHAHMRDLGDQGMDVTEFLPPVPWARHPYEDLNDSSSFHILEGRWLRNPHFVDALVDHLYDGAGNDRHFSESIAAATLAWTLVTGNAQPAIRHLDAMRMTYNLWDDHFDAARNLYWIEPILDATEFTISSIDASGAGFGDLPDGKNKGFFGGFAYRPSINAYQYGNARAIAALATQAGQPEVAKDYTQRANLLRTATVSQLWNPSLQHFTDIYQRSTPTVKAGDFIRGRELVGLVPWQFDLPPAQPVYADAWRHVLSPYELGGPTGLRTVEPTYPRYMRQYIYEKQTTDPECQWNGPSWPFQTSQILSGMANLLDDYPAEMAQHAGIDASAYVALLRQYTRQHRLSTGMLDLQEDYNPDTGAVIVGLPRSHHYLHSTYNDLILSGLIGIRPRADDVLELRPLIPTVASSAGAPIRFFALQGLRYHGHDLTIVYDSDGSRYHLGAGISIFSDGHPLLLHAARGPLTLPLPKSSAAVLPPQEQSLAVNVWGRAPSSFESDLPIATASSQAPEPKPIAAEAPMLYQPIDGRSWLFPEVPHGWSPSDAPTSEDWYQVDLRSTKTVAAVELKFTQSEHFAIPAQVRIQLRNSQANWTDVATLAPTGPVLKTQWKPIEASEIRVSFQRRDHLPERLISLQVVGPAK